MDDSVSQDFPLPQNTQPEFVSDADALREIAEGGNGRLEMEFSDEEFYEDEVEMDVGPEPDAW